MSATYDMACMQCKVSIWIGQKGSGDFVFYAGNPGCMAELSKFLWQHKGHHLELRTSEKCGVDEFKQVDLPDDQDRLPAPPGSSPSA